MTYTIHADGWVTGTLTGPGSVEYPIEKHECPRALGAPYRSLTKTPPDLLLHTTEGVDLDSAIATLRLKFAASQWACGENRIAQLRPLWAQGAAVDTQGEFFMQVENVAKSQLTLWLPAKETLNPLVALVAFLHKERIITTGLERPPGLASLPLVLDKGPQASASYYRRFLAPEPAQDGVRGHVDSKDDEHYDPGSFDYPAFFALVEGVLGGDSDMTTPAEKAQLARFQTYLDTLTKGLGSTADPTKPATAEGAGLRVAKAVKDAEDGNPGGVPKHSHKVSGTAT